MTGQALLIKAQVGPRFSFNILILDEFCLMTFFAGKRYMRSLKFISCKGVIKKFLIEMDHFKIYPMVIAVTFNAFFPLYLR
jgi:hypothetical protein